MLCRVACENIKKAVKGTKAQKKAVTDAYSQAVNALTTRQFRLAMEKLQRLSDSAFGMVDDLEAAEFSLSACPSETLGATSSNWAEGWHGAKAMKQARTQFPFGMVMAAVRWVMRCVAVAA